MNMKTSSVSKETLAVDMAVTISELSLLADKIEHTVYGSEEEMLDDIRMCATNAISTLHALAGCDSSVYDLCADCSRYDLPFCDRLVLECDEDLTELSQDRLHEIACDVVSDTYGEYVKYIHSVEAASPDTIVCYGIVWDFDTIDKEDGPPTEA